MKCFKTLVLMVCLYWVMSPISIAIAADTDCCSSCDCCCDCTCDCDCDCEEDPNCPADPDCDYDCTTPDCPGCSCGCTTCCPRDCNDPDRYPGGCGTLESPYIIASPTDLATLANCPNDWDDYFCQKSDIDMADCLPLNPIGNEDVPFTGGYQGNEYSIANLVVFSSEQGDVDGTGLFGVVGSSEMSGLIESVTLINAQVIGSTRDAGALVGRLYSGCVMYSRVMEGSVANSACMEDTSAGGLIGKICPDGIVVECYSTSMTSGSDFVGGLVGQNLGYVEFCYAENVVAQTGSWPSSSDNDVCIGGLIGYNNTGMIRSCYANSVAIHSFANVPSGVELYVGGLVGEWTISEMFFLFPYNYSRHCTPGLDQSLGNNAIGSPSQVDNQWANEVAQSEYDLILTLQETYASWDFDYVWDIDEGDDTPKLLVFE